MVSDSFVCGSGSGCECVCVSACVSIHNLSLSCLQLVGSLVCIHIFFPRGVASVAAAGGGWEGGLDVSIITCPPWTAHC